MSEDISPGKALIGMIFCMFPLLIGFFGFILFAFNWEIKILTGSIVSFLFGCFTMWIMLQQDKKKVKK